MTECEKAYDLGLEGVPPDYKILHNERLLSAWREGRIQRSYIAFTANWHQSQKEQCYADEREAWQRAHAANSACRKPSCTAQ